MHCVLPKVFALFLPFMPCVPGSLFDAANAHAFEAGTRWITINPAHRAAPERVLITYPAQPDGEAFTLGADALWTGVPARREATPVAERFPLVILSHGSGGNAASLGWLSTELARNGFIVAAPNHLHSTSGDSIPTKSLRLGERAKDITALIDALLADPQWSGRVDANRIGGIGFSLGGTTIMLAAGAEAKFQPFADHCTAAKGADGVCNWFQKGGVDFATFDRTSFEGSYRDPRISAMVAVDPGLPLAYTAESLAAIDMPTLFINLGEGDGIIPLVRAADVAKMVKGGEYDTVAGANHFTFLGVCNPDGQETLKRYGEEDPVCDDASEMPRAALHKQIFFKIAIFLRKTLIER